MITKLSKIFGKEVFSVSGSRVGRVVDVAIDVDTRRVSDVFISNLDSGFQKKFDLEGKKGVIFTYGGIRSISDIVVISDIKPSMREAEAGAAVVEEHTQGL